MFATNNHASLHGRLKENLVKHQRLSKYCENECLQNFLLLFYFVTAPIVKNSHIWTGIYFIFRKNLLKQIYWKGSDIVKRILPLFCNFVALKFRLKL